MSSAPIDIPGNYNNGIGHVAGASSYLPDELGSVLKKLGYLSMVKPGYKLHIKSMTFDSADSYVHAIGRWWDKEKSDKMVTSVESYINEALGMLNTYRGTDYHPIIIDAIKAAVRGIATLKETYAENTYTVSSLKVLLDFIRVELNREGVSGSPVDTILTEDNKLVKVMLAGADAGKRGEGRIVYHGD